MDIKGLLTKTEWDIFTSTLGSDTVIIFLLNSDKITYHADLHNYYVTLIKLCVGVKFVE